MKSKCHTPAPQPAAAPPRGPAPRLQNRSLLVSAGACLLALAAGGARSEVSFDWATVVDTENLADPADGDAFSDGVQHFGAVDHAYRIALHEVTNAQYAEFLNAVDPDGTNATGLYSIAMGNTVRGGISLVPSNAAGAKYGVKPNMAHKPVNHVSWSDAARFANWMNNGQGGAGTTESGAYDMASPNPVRLAGATFFLPSEDEWYKAAFFDPVNEAYSKYPTMSDQAPVVGQATNTGDIANPGPNVANYSCGAEWNGECNLTTVGSATSKSFYGAFDMAGNVWEWNESSPIHSRGVRGGGARFTIDSLDSSARGIPGMGDYDDVIGFRIARLPSDDPFPVVITSITRPNPGQALVAFTGITRQTYNVERSEDLAVWRVIGVGTENPVGSGLFDFLDTDGTADARYYRIAPVKNIPGFAYIPPGPFIMGNSIDDPDLTDADAVSVHVSAFYMGQTEVTTAQWNEVATWAASHGYAGLRQGVGAGNSPMMMVDWFHALVWCNARSEKEGKIPAYYTDEAYTTVYRGGVPGVLNGALPVFANWNTTGYRLPTEAEWEKAARGGLSRQRFPLGATISHSQANYLSDSSYAYDVSPTRGFHPDFADQLPQGFPIAPVRHFPPNGYGLYDMAGNLLEWCWDLYQTQYTAGAIDPRGATTGFRRVYRGGSWGFHAAGCRAAARSSREPWTDLPEWVNNSQFFGLRVVLPLE